MWNTFGWPKRIAVIVSVLWVLLALAFASSETNSLTGFIIVGAAPLTLLWGGYWIVSGFLASRRRTSRPLEPGVQATPAIASDSPSRTKSAFVGACIVIAGLVAASLIGQSARVGYLAGTWMVYALLGYVLIRLLVKDGLKAVVATTMLFSAGLVGQLLYERQLVDDLKSSMRAAMPIFTSLNRGEIPETAVLANPKLGVFGPVLRELSEGMKALVLGRDEFIASTKGLENALAPQALASPAGRIAAKNVIDRVGLAVDSYERAISNYGTHSVSNVKAVAMQMPDSVRTGFITSFENSTKKSLEMLSGFVQIERKLLAKMGEIISHAEVSKPTLQQTSAGVVLMFRSQAAVDRYNTLLREFQELARQEDLALKTIQDNSSSRLNSITDYLTR